MPPRPCLDCGAPTTAPRCRPCTLARRRQLYGHGHQTTRTDWTPAVNAGTVTCWRCQQPIHPGTPWDLGHRGDLPPHPEHARCNRSAPAR